MACVVNGPVYYGANGWVDGSEPANILAAYRVVLARAGTKDYPTDQRALAGQQWWYTHLRVRRAYWRLARLLESGALFCFLDPLTPSGATATTNMLEGRINAGLKRLLDLHRGLDESHVKRAAEWYLYLKSPQADPLTVLNTYLHEPTPIRKTRSTPPQPGTQIGIQLPGSNPDNINAYESGFGIRKGWIHN